MYSNLLFLQEATREHYLQYWADTIWFPCWSFIVALIRSQKHGWHFRSLVWTFPSKGCMTDFHNTRRERIFSRRKVQPQTRAFILVWEQVRLWTDSVSYNRITLFMAHIVQLFQTSVNDVIGFIEVLSHCTISIVLSFLSPYIVSLRKLLYSIFNWLSRSNQSPIY